MGYQEDATINRDALDKEWLALPLKEIRWGEAEAQSEEDLEALENQLELYKAELDGQIRSDAASFGIDKISEKAVESVVIKDAQVQQFKQKIMEARKYVRLMKLARKGISRVEKSLDRLTDLYFNHYWATEPPEAKVEKAVQNMEHRQFNEHMLERRKLKRQSKIEEGKDG